MSPVALILTCEHAGNRVPPAYGYLFKGKRAILATHEAYDLGALTMARRCAKALGAPLFFASETRLLVDQNRSIANRNIFSRFSRQLPASVKQDLINTLHRPYRDQIIRRVRECLCEQQQVLHFAIHTFAPKLHGRIRNADMGILYDPASLIESGTARSLRKTLWAFLPGLRIRYNYPYRGASDGLATALRKKIGMRHYAGIEIEINQKVLCGGTTRLSRALVMAVQSAVAAR